jgi:predicted O-methyltransferase YrrM
MTPTLEQKIHQWVAESDGWTSLERCLELAQLVLDENPKYIVELGVFGGRSFIPQALALKELNQPGAIAIGIDPWKKESALEDENEANRAWWASIDLDAIQAKFMRGIWHYDVEQWIAVIRARSQDVVGIMPQDIGLLTIDGNHAETPSTRDAHNYLPLVKSGGIVIMDDCDWTTTKRAQDYVASQCDLLKAGENNHYKIFRKR